ncbi:hypothetical protein BLNAU_10932 [Blattamonas nauphoetae]|uniref:Uncharacterized protein n=1 Tax=Blattamonas nauphoetae TaxID=2049346 RepID=A0ABQ9XSY2_9EUKA|nr:hypothetical protein BLNAU_10932 [Blattamonas nauphoetae]
MLVDKASQTTQVDKDKAKQKNMVEVFLSQICGECTPLRPAMLNSLLIVASGPDWALSTILDVEYIKPLEDYCEKTQSTEVTISLPKLLILIVPSGSTDRSSELVPFGARLCGRLAEHVSQMKSLFSESSPSDGTISALSTTLPDESPLLTGNAVFEVVCEGFSLCYSLLSDRFSTLSDILTHGDIVPLLQSTIITCLDLIEQLKSESICPPTDQQYKLTNILDRLWNCSANSLLDSHKSLHPVVESAFSDVPQLCSLLERTCCHSSPINTSHFRMLINVSATLPRMIPRMLEENLVQRVINASKSMTAPTSNGVFHLDLIWAIHNLIRNPTSITKNKDEQKRIQKLQFERVLTPAKQYLQFILQREEFIQKDDSHNRQLTTTVMRLVSKIVLLERDLSEDGEIVETGREEWEVGWLVEKTIKTDLGERLKLIRKDDERMKKDEKARWKKRVERRREAGHEDATEGWLIRRINRTPSEIVEFLRHASEESGMNA